MSVRTRLLVTSLVTLGVGLGALAVAGNVLLATRVEDDTSSVLRERADTQLAALEVRGDLIRVREPPNDARLDERAWVLSGERVVERPVAAPPNLDAAAVALGRARRVAEREGADDIRLRAQPLRMPSGRTIGAVVVAYDVAPLESLQQQVLVASLVIAALVLLAGALAINDALRGAWRRIDAMISSAERWSADVAHELRTPIAGLRGRAELALHASNEERTEALHAIVAQTDRVDRAIDTLLALARQELDPSRGAADVAAIAREHAGDDPRADLRVTGGPAMVNCDPEIVRRSLAPLVDNARRHARSRIVLDVTRRGGRVQVAVRDDGEGVDPELLEAVFDPGHRTSGGAGLGLPLARRLARSCGGDVVARHEPSGGCFLLELPELPR